MIKIVPTTGGIDAWFTGEQNISDFAESKLPSLGKGLKAFSDALNGINVENVNAATSAATSLSKLISSAPEDSSKITSLGTNLTSFGNNLKSYFQSTSQIKDASITSATKAIESVNKASRIDAAKLTTVSKALTDVVDSLSKLGSITKGTVSGFNQALAELGKTNADAFISAFNDLDNKLSQEAKNGLDSFVKGINSKKNVVTTAAKNTIEVFLKYIKSNFESIKKYGSTLATKCVEGINSKKSSFETAGKNLATGFANGINANAYKAAAQAKAMAAAAAEAAKKELDEHSPSKVGYKIGDFFGVAFVNAIGDYANKAYKAGSTMASMAKIGLRESISKIRDIINGDLDTQPTIRPVLDLSGVEAGTGVLNGMLNMSSSVGVLANARIAGSMINRSNQNGGTNDVVSAIDKLRKDLSNISSNNYNINGVSYEEGSDVSEAFKAIIREAKIDRRS